MIILWLLPVKYWKELHSDNTVASKIVYRIIIITTIKYSINMLYVLLSYLNITNKWSTNKQEEINW